MSHIVVYQADDGSSVYEMCSGLDAAVVVAERVRNVEGVESPEIFELTAVPYDFKPYFRVEVAPTGAALSSIASDVTPIDQSTPADDPDPRLGASAMFGSAGEPVEAEAASDDETETALDDDGWVSAADAEDTATDTVEDDASNLTDETEMEQPEIPEDLSDLPPPPSAEDVAGLAPEPEQPADEPDPMVSVRRGLFGR